MAGRGGGWVVVCVFGGGGGMVGCGCVQGRRVGVGEGSCAGARVRYAQGKARHRPRGPRTLLARQDLKQCFLVVLQPHSGQQLFFRVVLVHLLQGSISCKQPPAHRMPIRCCSQEPDSRQVACREQRRRERSPSVWQRTRVVSCWHSTQQRYGSSACRAASGRLGSTCAPPNPPSTTQHPTHPAPNPPSTHTHTHAYRTRSLARWRALTHVAESHRAHHDAAVLRRRAGEACQQEAQAHAHDHAAVIAEGVQARRKPWRTPDPQCRQSVPTAAACRAFPFSGGGVGGRLQPQLLPAEQIVCTGASVGIAATHEQRALGIQHQRLGHPAPTNIAPHLTVMLASSGQRCATDRGLTACARKEKVSAGVNT